MKQLILFLLIAGSTNVFASARTTDALSGAWQTRQGDVIQTVVFVDGYLSHSIFDIQNKEFISTRGGTYTTNGTKLTVTWQYDTDKASSNVPADTWVGQSSTFDITSGNTLTTNLSGVQATWERIDTNEGPMAGVWRIT